MEGYLLPSHAAKELRRQTRVVTRWIKAYGIPLVTVGGIQFLDSEGQARLAELDRRQPRLPRKSVGSPPKRKAKAKRRTKAELLSVHGPGAN